MDDNKIFITWRPKRSITLDFLLIVLLAVSIMCMPACSSDSDNAAVQPNYIVQATVSVEEDGPIAYALVMDGDQNLVSTLNLTINGDPMTIEYLGGGDVESTEAGDGSPIYTMDLSDLKGGDMVVFEARDQFGVIIYAPEPAVIPMAIELLEPEEGQEVMAGDEVIIRWTGGEGAEVFSAAYAALDGSALFWDDLEPSESGAYTVPAGQTVEGAGIVGVGAITGDTAVIGTFDGEFMSGESYFLVSRDAGITIDISPVTDGKGIQADRRSTGCPAGKGISDSTVSLGCMAQFAALGIGAIVWEARRQIEFRDPGLKKCDNSSAGGAWIYCHKYAAHYGWGWKSGCFACAEPCFMRSIGGLEPRCDCNGEVDPVWINPTWAYCDKNLQCSGRYYYCP